jgi:pilus assembly protein CpaB
MIGIRNLPASYVEERHIQAADAERIIGVRVSMGVKANESLLWTDLATTAQQRRDLSGLVRNGMRAVTIKAEMESAFGGLLRPGDRVDCLLTTTKAESRERVTIPLLQNVLVLAVGSDVGATQSQRRADRQRYREVSLSVTVEQAQILTFAGDVGELTLILRNPDDIAILEELPETTARNILEIEERRALIRREPEQERPRIPENLGSQR